MKESLINNPELKLIFESLEEKSSKEFSKALKPLRKKYTEYGPMRDKNPEWKEVFEYTFGIFIKMKTQGSTPHSLYNLLRFIRLLAINQVIQEHFYNELALIYLDTITEPNGNIRNAGYSLLDNMIFGLTPLSRDEEGKHKPVRQKLLEIFGSLQHLEVIYTEEHKSKLRKNGDLHGRKWRKDSVDTKDKILKNIRRGIELIDSGFYFDRILEEFGFLEKLRMPEQIEEYLQFKEKYKENKIPRQKLS